MPSDHESGVATTFSRRAALKALSTVALWPYLSDAAAAEFAARQAQSGPAALTFLTPAHYATVDALAEAIIPQDDHSPGARAARVADYIDLLLAESDQATQKAWMNGLAVLDSESHRRFTGKFAELPASQKNSLLTAMSRAEADPKTPLDQFFKTTKDAVIRGYYTSEVGILRELEYRGNRMLGEFVGCTHPEHGYKAE